MVLTPGFEPFPAASLPRYGYGRFPNVITALEFERVLYRDLIPATSSAPATIASPSGLPSSNASARGIPNAITAPVCAACTPPRKR